jgi:hypothetical protein
LRGEKVVEELAALRCACGHGISVELRDTGERVGYAVFFDNEPTSETYSVRVHECPGCGGVIGLHTLIPSDIHRRKPEGPKGEGIARPNA